MWRDRATAASAARAKWVYEPRTAACGAGMKSCFLEMIPHSCVIAARWVASHHLYLYALRL